MKNLLIDAVLDNINLNFDSYNTKIDAEKEIEMYFYSQLHNISDDFDDSINIITSQDIKEVQDLLNEKFGFNFMNTSEIYNYLYEELEKNNFYLENKRINEISEDAFYYQEEDKRDPTDYIYYVINQVIPDEIFEEKLEFKQKLEEKLVQKNIIQKLNKI